MNGQDFNTDTTYATVTFVGRGKEFSKVAEFLIVGGLVSLVFYGLYMLLVSVNKGQSLNAENERVARSRQGIIPMTRIDNEEYHTRPYTPSIAPT
jgi:hypothetical protein